MIYKVFLVTYSWNRRLVAPKTAFQAQLDFWLDLARLMNSKWVWLFTPETATLNFWGFQFLRVWTGLLRWAWALSEAVDFDFDLALGRRGVRGGRLWLVLVLVLLLHLLEFLAVDVFLWVIAVYIWGLVLSFRGGMVVSQHKLLRPVWSFVNGFPLSLTSIQSISEPTAVVNPEDKCLNSPSGDPDEDEHA